MTLKRLRKTDYQNLTHVKLGAMSCDDAHLENRSGFAGEAKQIKI